MSGLRLYMGKVGPIRGRGAQATGSRPRSTQNRLIRKGPEENRRGPSGQLTVPGKPEGGPGVAFLAELVISFGLMMVVLVTMNIHRLARFTGLFAGALVAIYIILVAPLSGMSMNPARTFASALPAQLWTALWIYFAAPPLGMLLAAECYLQLQAALRVFCAKLHHHNDKRCIFHCGYKEGRQLAMGD